MKITEIAQYREVVVHTIDWLMHKIRAPNGAFFSSLDADSEEEERKFYVWQRDELRQLLDGHEYALLQHC